MPKNINYIGNRYGRLVVMGSAPKDSHGRTVLRCQCDCGTVKDIRAGSLQQGLTKSCGCLRHGLRKTRLYTIWSHMQQRCENPNHNRYRLYGARGIKICPEWRQDFTSFHSWAVGNGYDDTLSIDRIDVDGDYTPDNCRWIPLAEQSKNRRPYRHVKRRVS